MKRIVSFCIVFMSLSTGSCALGPDAFVAVHLEPTNLNYYGALVDMVALADSFRAPLTLEFTPQWADTIMKNPSLLLQMRGWQKNGHEIAAHHHAVSYGVGGWDGYTNRPPSEYPVAFKYRGNMAAFFLLLSKLAGDSLLLTGCITDAEVDWPAGILFRTEGHNVTEGLTRPTTETLNGQAVIRLGFGLINTKLRVDTAKALFNSAGSKDIIGVVLHEKDYSDNKMNLRSWLQFLKDKGKAVKTVRQILRERGYATGVAFGQSTALLVRRDRIVLHPAFPNPFNASTVLKFELGQAALVRIELFNAEGRRVMTSGPETRGPGEHALRLDLGVLPSGAYFAVLRAEGLTLVRKMMLLR